MTALLIRLCWFYFAGLWLGGIWLAVAWLLCVSIIGLPAGLWMIHRAPAIFTLRQGGVVKEFEFEGKAAYYFDEVEQPNFLIRVIYFLVFGWWFSLLWAKLALVAAATFVGLPVAFWMINRLPYVVSLHRG